MVRRSANGSSSAVDHLDGLGALGNLEAIRIGLIEIFLRPELREFEAKTFFEANYSQIYFIFFETISNLDTTFKQKGTSRGFLIALNFFGFFLILLKLCRRTAICAFDEPSGGERLDVRKKGTFRRAA